MSASLKETLALLKGAKNKYARGGGKTVKPKEGKTRVRILQGPDAKFWRDLGVHWIKNAEGKVLIAVGCDYYTYDKPCPIDTAIDKAMKAATSDDEVKMIKEWKAKKSVLLNALILDGPDASPDPQVLELTPTTFGNFLSIMEEYADEVGNVLDAETGLDFIIERRGKGFDTEYTIMPAPKSKPVPKAALSKLNDLDDFIDREYFAGRNTKALNFIGELTGVKVALAAPTRSALLTGPAGSVAEEVTETADEVVERVVARKAAKTIEVEAEVVEELETPAPAPKKAAAPAPKASAALDDVDEDDLASVLSDLDDLG